jgi:signal transduction histidine kinase/CheY-like chemotaxis protein
MRNVHRLSTQALSIIMLISVFGVLTGAQHWIGRLLYEQGFTQAEEADLVGRARHAKSILEASQVAIRSTAADYASWQSTYLFAVDANPTYAADNWQHDTFKRFEIDALVIIGKNDRVMLAARIDWNTRQLTFVAEQDPLVRAARAGGKVGRAFRDASEQSDLAVLDGVPYLWAGARIQRYDAPGPSYGRLFLFRELGGVFRQRVGADVGARLSFSVDQSDRTQTVTPHAVGDLQFEAMTGEEAGVSFEAGGMPDGERVRATLVTNRLLHATVARTNTFTLLTSLLIGTILALVAVVFLKKRVLGPLAFLEAELQRIGESGEKGARLIARGRGREIAVVTESLNRMIATIESKQDAETARDAAVEADRLKSEFLAVMSHEIRTPMNGVLGMLELLDHTELSEQQRSRLRTARESATALLELLNSILDLSRLEAGRMTVDARPANLRELCRQVCALFEARSLGKGVVLECEYAEELPTEFVIDSGKLRQVLVNLVGNAVKFTERGRITVRASPGRAPNTIRLTVHDTGIGIKAEYLARLFEPFAQESAGIARRFGGSGLGLAISKRLADLMGYELSVTSKVGEGTTFTLDLTGSPVVMPGTLDAQRPTDSGRQASAEARLELTVLIAEDNEVNQVVIGAILDQLGCRHVIVSDGAQALAEWERTGGSFDAILMDLHMPNMDGLEAARRVRAWERSQGRQAAPVPVIALTASAMMGDRESCMAAGMSGYVAKPYRMQDIRMALESIERAA